MDISDVRVKLVRDPGERLKAVCTVTFDGLFVVRDVKVVEGTNGLFVAMPSQKLSVHCPKCRQKNHLRAKFCNECGAKLPPSSAPPDSNGRSRLHRDIAHPIKAAFRQMLQEQVIEAFNEELERADSPDYEPSDLDYESGEDEAGAREPQPVEKDVSEPEEVESREDIEDVEAADDDDDRERDDREGSDYDDIIAELRGRSGGFAEPKHEERPRRQERPQRQEQPQRRQESSGERPRREERSEERPPRERSQRRRRGRGGQPRDDRQSERPPQQPAPAFGSGVPQASTEEDKPKPAPRPEPQPAKPEKPAEKKDDTDSVPFGHGIL